MIKTLLKYVKEYKKVAIITPILVLLEVVLEIMIPLVMAELIDQGIDGGSMPDIVKYGIELLIFAILALAFGVAAGRTASVASAGFARNLRGAMYDHVQEFSLSQREKGRKGSLPWCKMLYSGKLIEKKDRAFRRNSGRRAEM